MFTLAVSSKRYVVAETWLAWSKWLWRGLTWKACLVCCKRTFECSVAAMLRFSLLIPVELFVFDPSFNFLHALVCGALYLLSLSIYSRRFGYFNYCSSINHFWTLKHAMPATVLPNLLCLSTPSTCTARAKAWRQQQARIHVSPLRWRIMHTFIHGL